MGDKVGRLRFTKIAPALFDVLTFFKLTDPPTSPNRVQDQILFGLIAAGVAVAAQTAWAWPGVSTAGRPGG